MSEQVLLSAGRANFDDCIRLALRRSLGIEVMAFAFPDVLDGNWPEILAHYKEALRPIRGLITMHGPFMDMAPGSPDGQIRSICHDRFCHAIRIADELGARLIVFHANFIASIHNVEYRYGWHQRNLDFWGPVADYAQQHDVMIAMENMWEFDPTIIGDVLSAMNHPYLRACLDVGHSALFGPDHSLETWLNVLEPWLIHCHLNNNDGVIDVHHGLNDGVLDYVAILDRLRGLPLQPSFTLEIDRVVDMESSLPYFHLTHQTGRLRDRLYVPGYTTPSPD